MPRLSETPLVVIDTETTGADPTTAEVIEVAVRRFWLDGRQPEATWSTLVKPLGKVPPVASAVHHLTDEDLKDSPSFEDIRSTLEIFVGDSPVIAHNADYDKTMLSSCVMANRPWWDTYRLAMRIWAIGDVNENGHALESFKQQELRYWLGLPRTGGDAHRAAADIEVTAHLFRAAASRYLAADGADDVAAFEAWLASPIVHRTLPFGFGMAGKQPEELEDWQLRKAFSPDSPSYEAFAKFSVHDYLRPTYHVRIGPTAPSVTPAQPPAPHITPQDTSAPEGNRFRRRSFSP